MINNPFAPKTGGGKKYTITDQIGYGLPAEAQAGELVEGHINQYAAGGRVWATKDIWTFGNTALHDRQRVPSFTYDYELPMGMGSGQYIGFIMPPSNVVVNSGLPEDIT